MLKGIDARISPDLLRVLARMGHGDEIVIADANFPSAAVARHTVAGEELRIDCDAVAALRAILSLLPLDTYEPDPVLTMQVVGDAAAVPAVLAEAAPLLAAQGVRSAALERFAFYEKAKQAYCVITTGETRFYGCFLLTKGVIPPK